MEWLRADGVTPSREAAARKLRASAIATKAVRSARSPRSIAEFLSLPNAIDMGFSFRARSNNLGLSPTRHRGRHHGHRCNHRFAPLRYRQETARQGAGRAARRRTRATATTRTPAAASARTPGAAGPRAHRAPARAGVGADDYTEVRAPALAAMGPVRAAAAR